MVVMPADPRRLRILEHLEAFLREVGTLLIALAPLDAAYSADRPARLRLLLIFFSLGAFFILVALSTEYRRTKRGS